MHAPSHKTDATQAEIVMMLMPFLTTQHGQFALPITQYLKPHQVQPFFELDMLFDICLWLTGTTKLENTGNH
jgi:hypothetical protein